MQVINPISPPVNVNLLSLSLIIVSTTRPCILKATSLKRTFILTESHPHSPETPRIALKWATRMPRPDAPAAHWLFCIPSWPTTRTCEPARPSSPPPIATHQETRLRCTRGTADGLDRASVFAQTSSWKGTCTPLQSSQASLEVRQRWLQAASDYPASQWR